MKNVLLLCSKNVHFTFENNIYKQKDEVAMGSPIGPVLAGIFMVHLERKRYVEKDMSMISSFILNQTSSRMSLIF